MPADTAKPGKDRSLQVVVHHMAKLEIPGLPRNYTLFHDAIAGTDQVLAREVAALPHGAPQAQIDEIGLRHGVIGFASPEVLDRSGETQQLLDLVETLAHASLRKRDLLRILDDVGMALDNGAPGGTADRQAQVDRLKTGVNEAWHAESALSKVLEGAADRLMTSNSIAEAARATSLRDSLTGLPNHAALAERLTALYADDAAVPTGALFLVRLVDIADLSAAYGAAAAGRIIRKAASIFRKAIKKQDFLARVGADEFAFLFSDIDRDAARAIAERLSASIAENLIFANSGTGHSARMRVAAGIAMAEGAFAAHELRAQATGALASRKTGGITIHGEAARRVS